jgi:putative transposase
MTAAPAPKPDVNEPGSYLPNGAAAKSGLNREILDVSFGEFRRQLEYKSQWYGSETITVNPAYTSQTCNSCGHVDAGNRHGEAFLCLDCGHTADADVNAALNILAKGLKK